MADLVADILPPLLIAAALFTAWLENRRRHRIRRRRHFGEFLAGLAVYVRTSDTDSAWMNRSLIQAAVESEGGSLFDSSVRDMLGAAREAARQNCDDWVAPIHLLLALPNSDLVCTQVLSGHGLSSADVLWRAREALILGPVNQPPSRVPFGPEAAGVLVAAIREAKRLNHHSVWPGHILSILADTGLPGEVLRSLGITHEAVEEELLAKDWIFG